MTYTTYYIENLNDFQVYGYFNTLYDAKQTLLKMLTNTNDIIICLNDFRIVCLKGPYKYEGRHAYYLIFNGTKFQRICK